MNSNWLIKLCNDTNRKAEYLYAKYLPMFIRSREQEQPNLDSNMRQNLHKHLQDNFRGIIDQGMRFNHKYAEWYVYQSIVSELNPSTQQRRFRDFTFSSKFNEVKDWLEHGNGSIPSVATPYQEVIQLSDAWHEAMAAKAAEYKTNDIVAELSDGFKLVRVPAQDAKAEGYHMGHCVGGYCEDINNNSLYIYSIRDKENKPHITIEVVPHNQKLHYLEIEQMKGKSNKPQPKYVKYLEEALNVFASKYLITISNEGWMDYTGFQEDLDAQDARIISLVENQPDWLADHQGSAIQIYKLGKTPPSQEILEKYLQTGEMDERINELVSSGDSFYQYATESNLDQIGDICIDMHRDGIISDEELEEVQDGIKRGQFDTSSDEIAQVADSFIQSSVDDIDFLRSYALAEHLDEVIQYYISSSFNGYDDAEQDYTRWSQYFQKQRREQIRQQNKDRLINIINTYNLQIPNEIREELLGKWLSRLHFQEPDERLSQRMQEDIDRKIYDIEQAKLHQMQFEQTFAQWDTLLGQQVPGYLNVNEFDRRMLVDRFDWKNTIDQEVLGFAQLLVRNKTQVAEKHMNWLHKIAQQGQFAPGSFAILSNFGYLSFSLVKILSWDEFRQYETDQRDAENRGLIPCITIDVFAQDNLPEYDQENKVHAVHPSNLYKDLYALIRKQAKSVFPDVIIEILSKKHIGDFSKTYPQMTGGSGLEDIVEYDNYDVSGYEVMIFTDKRAMELNPGILRTRGTEGIFYWYIPDLDMRSRYSQDKSIDLAPWQTGSFPTKQRALESASNYIDRLFYDQDLLNDQEQLNA